jgi:hypothetical protein
MRRPIIVSSIIEFAIVALDKVACCSYGATSRSTFLDRGVSPICRLQFIQLPNSASRPLASGGERNVNGRLIDRIKAFSRS